MGIDPIQLRELIVRPALVALNMHSEAAENLVMGTAAQESLLGKFLKQVGGGPALSIFQIEPATYQDYWDGYLADHPDVANLVRKAVCTNEGTPPAGRMVWDLRYAAMMCRIHYRRIRSPLPDAQDVWALAAYWKKYYNTVHGAGTEQEFVDHYEYTQ